MVGKSRELGGLPKVRDLELVQLYVSLPGQGLGEQLLNTVVPPGTGAQLWVFTANEGAQRFYRRHGFAPDGARNVYREDLAGGVDELRYVR
jgi:ribosomal protein S18 acetylase RimI-like enzyme